tara:strand:+ start:882 stop:1142 length:261 start_codon:yes stop_codon:yes gene_type:complete
VSEPTPSAQDSLRVTLQDVRTARYCLAGVRPWFRRHGFSWSEFLGDGIEAERLRTTGDALIDPVIRAAEARMACETYEAPEARHGR